MNYFSYVTNSFYFSHLVKSSFHCSHQGPWAHRLPAGCNKLLCQAPAYKTTAGINKKHLFLFFFFLHFCSLKTLLVSERVHVVAFIKYTLRSRKTKQTLNKSMQVPEEKFTRNLGTRYLHTFPSIQSSKKLILSMQNSHYICMQCSKISL